MFKFVFLEVISTFYSEFSFIRLSIITFHIFNDSENDSTSSKQTLNYASNFFDRNLKFCLQQGVCGRHSPYLLYLARLRTTFIASTFIWIEFLTSTISSLRKFICWANNKRYNANCTYLIKVYSNSYWNRLVTANLTINNLLMHYFMYHFYD